MLYDPHHPNYDFLPSVKRGAYADTELDDVLDYHQTLSVADDLTVVIVGAFDVRKTLAQLKRRIERLGVARKSGSDIALVSGVQADTANRLHIFPMRDKQNLDVVMGIPTPLLRTSPDYLPLYVGNFVLGGNFSSRLMQIIRDEMGLTYGIRSTLNGISTEHSGHWQLSVTLSSDALKQGLQSVESVFSEFCSEGATEPEVNNKKTTIRGNYSTRVSTTGALAGSILQGVQMGFGPHYPDIYRQQIDAVTIDQVNDAITRYLSGKYVSTSIAGSIDPSSAAALRPSE
jgi:predicted Zn-dependent peptidase